MSAALLLLRSRASGCASTSLTEPAGTLFYAYTPTCSTTTIHASEWLIKTGGHSLHFNLRLLNLWLGLADGAAGLPSDIHALGYRNAGIERRFDNQDGKQVNPELILASADEKHCLVFEWKSGSNTDTDQLNRCARISSDDLRQRAFVHPAAAAKMDVTVIGKEEHEADLAHGIQVSGHSFPLLLASETGLSRKQNAFGVASLNGLFDPELELDWSSIPTGYVPVDADSELWEVAAAAFPKIIAQMHAEVPSAHVGQLAEHVCELTWKVMGAPGRQAIIARIRDAVRDAEAHEFAGVWRLDGSGSGKVEILQKLDPNEPGARTRMLKSLARRTGEAIDRLKKATVEPPLFTDP